MFNPFREPVTSWSPQPSEIRADTNDTVHTSVVFLDDAVYPDAVHADIVGPTGDIPSPVSASYSQGDESIELVFTPGPQHTQQFESPIPDYGVPGTDILAIHHGPVTGRPIDVWQEGNKTPTVSVAPGQYGPVGSTEADYATRVAYANFQQLQVDYSNASADFAQIAAI